MDQATEKMNLKGKPLCLMFQDEARFGRLSDPRACWAPKGYRPTVKSALVRDYKYVFGAVAPKTGHFDYMVAENMKTENMSLFLNQVHKAHRRHFVIMVVDGASTHKSKDLVIPKEMSLILLPPYSPELNPVERVWNILRRDYFANKYFDSLDKAIDEAEYGLTQMKSDKNKLKSLTKWPWISEILNAT
jgi:transposase